MKKYTYKVLPKPFLLQTMSQRVAQMLHQHQQSQTVLSLTENKMKLETAWMHLIFNLQHPAVVFLLLSFIEWLIYSIHTNLIVHNINYSRPSWRNGDKIKQWNLHKTNEHLYQSTNSVTSLETIFGWIISPNAGHPVPCYHEFWGPMAHDLDNQSGATQLA